MDNLGTYTVCTTSFEYLCGKGEAAALAPMLAESWSPNDDGSVWTFKLRSGVKWHDGSAFTSADVVATLDRLAGANLKAYIVEGASKAIDDLTVEVTLNNPDGQFPYQLSLYNPQSLITPADYELGTLLDQKPAGTGAFMLDKFDVATGATFLPTRPGGAASRTSRRWSSSSPTTSTRRSPACSVVRPTRSCSSRLSAATPC